MERHNPINYFAQSNHRRRKSIFGIKQEDRMSHLYIVGKTGTGKTTLLETLIHQDISMGRGIALLDPHGDLVERVARCVPEERMDDLIYFNVPDERQPFRYNPLRYVHPSQRTLVASGLLEVFEKMWSSAWGPRMEYILRNAILALLEYPDATLMDILRMLSNDDFRKTIGGIVKNPRVKDFWLREYEGYSSSMRTTAIAPIQSKVGALLSDRTLNRIFTEPQGGIRIRSIMDENKIFLVNLSKGRLGGNISGFLGGFLVNTIAQASFSRANIGEKDRTPFYLYIDEFQNFTTQSVGDMLSELRKYRVGMILAHQFLFQIPDTLRNSVLGNVGTMVSFRLGPKDATLMAKQFEPIFEPRDFINLPNHHIYLKLMIDGTPSHAFSATTLAPQHPFFGDYCVGQK